MCKCGCNTCETKITGPLLTESKVKSLLSENLQFHINENIPLSESKLGLKSKTLLIKEAKKMYSRNILDLSEDDIRLIKTYLNEVKIDEKKELPTQDQVNKFFSLTQNEIHYLNSKPVKGQEKTFNKMEVEPWDEYDLSNWDSLVRKAKAKGKIDEKLKGIDGKACWKGYKLAGTKKKGGKTVDNCVPMKESNQDWPQEVLSLYGDITFKLEKVMPDRARYQVLDTETGKIWDIGGYVFGKVSELESFASNYIKPLGGRQSSQFEESIESLKKKPLK
jgi:hypothetical protein